MMGWFRSADATALSVGRHQFIGRLATDGHYYFDLPQEVWSHASSVGLVSSAPPPDPPPEPIDRASIVREITEEVEQRLRQALATPARPT